MAEDTQGVSQGLLSNNSLSPEMLAQIQALAQSAGPSEKDRKDALTNTLFQMAAGILGARDGNPFRAIGQGALPAIQNYPKYLSDIGTQRAQALQAGSMAMNSLQNQAMLNAKMPLLKQIGQMAAQGNAPVAGPQPFQSQGGAAGGFNAALSGGQPPTRSLQPAGTQSPQNAYENEAQLNYLMGIAGLGDHTAAFKAKYPLVGQDFRAGSSYQGTDGKMHFVPKLDEGMTLDESGAAQQVPNYQGTKNAQQYNRQSVELTTKPPATRIQGGVTGFPTGQSAYNDLFPGSQLPQGVQPPGQQSPATLNGPAVSASNFNPDTAQTAPLTPQQRIMAQADAARMGKQPLENGQPMAPVGNTQGGFVQTERTPEQTTVSTGLGEQRNAIRSASDNAMQQRGNIAQLDDYAKKIGFGASASMRLDAGKWLYDIPLVGSNVASLFVKNPDVQIPAMQAYNKIAFGLVAKQTRDLGPREAVQAMQMVASANPNITLTAGGDAAIRHTLRGTNQYAIDTNKYADQYEAEHKTMQGFSDWMHTNHPFEDYVPALSDVQLAVSGKNPYPLNPQYQSNQTVKAQVSKIIQSGKQSEIAELRKLGYIQ